jgi:A/G-specific adenine glycosylase
LIVKTRTLFQKEISLFQNTIYEHYHAHGRSFPWRQTTDPYHILVSEFMLQQTQTERVINYYGLFIEQFPNFRTLANAKLKDVLERWHGLGYNRRAIHLKKAAEEVMIRYQGKLPESFDEIVKLPGIGSATAGAILAFAFNKPVAFIETNIRRVFIHVFFQDRRDIRDGDILPFVKKTLDEDNPRQWYYALMDYGAMLKKNVSNPNRRSAHYTRQAPFEGSDRQIRGMIIRQLLSRNDMHEQALIDFIGADPDRAKKNLLRLKEEGFLILSESKVKLR